MSKAFRTAGWRAVVASERPRGTVGALHARRKSDDDDLPLSRPRSWDRPAAPVNRYFRCDSVRNDASLGQRVQVGVVRFVAPEVLDVRPKRKHRRWRVARRRAARGKGALSFDAAYHRLSRQFAAMPLSTMVDDNVSYGLRFDMPEVIRSNVLTKWRWGCRRWFGSGERSACICGCSSAPATRSVTK